MGESLDICRLSPMRAGWVSGAESKLGVLAYHHLPPGLVSVYTLYDVRAVKERLTFGEI